MYLNVPWFEIYICDCKTEEIITQKLNCSQGINFKLPHKEAFFHTPNKCVSETELPEILTVPQKQVTGS